MSLTDTTVSGSPSGSVSLARSRAAGTAMAVPRSVRNTPSPTASGGRSTTGGGIRSSTVVSAPAPPSSSVTRTVTRQLAPAAAAISAAAETRTAVASVRQAVADG